MKNSIKRFSFYLVLNQPCSSFKKNTPLHLACAALSLSTAQALLQAGANKQIIDEQQRTPAGKNKVLHNK
jgi:ankyrin repeat protein